MNNKTIVITGVDGYLGGLISKRIIETTDYNILGTTISLDLTEEMIQRMRITESDRISFMTNDSFFDISSSINIYGAIHLAFSRRMCPASDIASSIDFSARIYNKFKELNIDRIINMSSQGVYGNTSQLRTEDTIVAPETQYTMAKYASEVLFNTIIYDTPHRTSIRLDPVAQSQNVIRGLCKSAKEGLIRLKGGKQVFSFIDGEDVATAVVALLKTDSDWENVYNVGWNNKRYSLTELANLVADAAKECGYLRPQIEMEESDISLWAGMDSSKFINATGWKPNMSLKQTIISMIKDE